MKNKLFILSLTLLCTTQIALCMDEQRIIKHRGFITFTRFRDGIIDAFYFGKERRKVVKIIFGKKITAETPCIPARIEIKNASTLSQKDLLTLKHFSTKGCSDPIFLDHIPIPFTNCISNNYKTIEFPKADLTCIESPKELISMIEQAKKRFIERDYLIYHALFEKPKKREKTKQKLIDKKIIISYPKPVFKSNWSYFKDTKHAPRGYASPLQGQEENMTKLLMRREMNGSFKKNRK